MFANLNREIESILHRDPAARSKAEIIFCYPGFHALMFYRISNWLWHKGLKLFARWLSQVARFLTGIEIHPGATIGKNFFIDHGMGVVIGETSTIGNDVTIYHGVTLGGVTLKAGKRHPQIGDNVIIGAGAQLLGPIEVGNGARIGSNAVVVRDVPPHATMVGVPARNVAECKTEKEFSAYGVSGDDLPDMVVKRLDELAARIKELEGGDESANKWELGNGK